MGTQSCRSKGASLRQRGCRGHNSASLRVGPFIGLFHATPLYRLPATALPQSVPRLGPNATFATLRWSGSLVRVGSGWVTCQLQSAPGHLHHLCSIVTRRQSGGVIAAADRAYGQRDSLLECPERE